MVLLAPLSAEQINTSSPTCRTSPIPWCSASAIVRLATPSSRELPVPQRAVLYTGRSFRDAATISKSVDISGEACCPIPSRPYSTCVWLVSARPGRSLLNKASVLGSSFEFPGDRRNGAPRPLERGSRARTAGGGAEVRYADEEGMGTRITYQFWHPLLSSHLYAKLSAARRGQPAPSCR